ncbi:MAG TPA: hypothetical protein PLV93_08855 [Microthrixaceae bacterium]|nr:hypothetical protein [Microthrixaceae bacterium]
MTSTIATRPTSAATQRNVARGEWIKFRSVRSTTVTLISAALVTVIFGAIFAVSAGNDGGVSGPPGMALSNPLSISLGAINLSQLIVGILGVLITAGEYSTGLIRSTFAAVGSRLAVLRAKSIVIAGSVFVVMGVGTTLAVAVGQMLYAGDQATVSLTDPDTLRVVLGATLYLTGVALMGVALGFIVRSTSSAIGILVAALFIGPTLLGLLPDSVTDTVLRYLPSKAGESMMALTPTSDLLPTGTASVVFAAWVVGMLSIAALLVRRRDA